MQRTYKKVKVTAQRFKGFENGVPVCEDVEYTLVNPRLKEENFGNMASVRKALRAQIGKEANTVDIKSVETISCETYELSEEEFLKYARKVEKQEGENE